MAPRVVTTRPVSANRSSASQSWTTASIRRTPARISSGFRPPGCGTTRVSGARTAASDSPVTVVTSAISPPSAEASSSWPEPRTAHRPACGAVGTATGTQSRANRSSCPPSAAAAIRAGSTSRSASDATLATGLPPASAASMRTAPDSSGAIRTRRAVAPAACSSTPLQANGNAIRSGAPARSPTACSAESSSAGCRPKGAPSVSTATSAYTSSPRRQAARSPWKRGPYSAPSVASRSYTSSRSTASAPAGGQDVRSCAGTGSAGRRTPVAWVVHGSSSAAAYTVKSRAPVASGSPAVAWRRTLPCSGSTSGSETVSSSTTGQSNRAPAARAISTNAVPGSSGTPPTRWSPSHGWAERESRPVCRAASASARSTAAPSSGWPIAGPG